MFKKLFGQKKQAEPTVAVKAPLTGTIVQLEEVPDPVFSQKMMGDGVAIQPTEGKVVSPVDGEIIQVFPTKHAVGLKADNGLEILIHIGLETVSMNGEGFEAHVSEGKRVSVGDPLVTFDLEKVKAEAKSTITPVILTNADQIEAANKHEISSVQAGNDAILTVTVKA
ncbi:PTS sugar transporter subunit IIA [Bacillus fonticola]|uniref:PTS sugar transporter subunit IIA n=1 Tax=Bacillus fonticola TaxID=2728853 RepID=UPI00147437CE|nr:PTS glucose transporter subunit IIA [Bacillus fonticola]